MRTTRLVLLVVIVLAVLVSQTPVHAQSQSIVVTFDDGNPGPFVPFLYIDNFTDSLPPLYVSAGYGCSPGGEVCATLASEGGRTFARLTYNGDLTQEGVYYVTDLHDTPVFIPPDFPLSPPTAGHECVIESTVRYLNLQDGSAGFWLWEWPFLPDGTAGPQNAMGVQWLGPSAPPQMSNLKGLSEGTVVQNNPIVQFPLPQVNLSAWNTYRQTWSVANNGSQLVTFEVEGYGGSRRTMTRTTMLGTLWVEIWLDNQIGYQNVVKVNGTQMMDIDNISISCQ